MSRPPPRCLGCQDNRVAWVTPRVDYCYDCLPGGPFTPPPCRGCGSREYFSQGLCERCHPGGPLHLGACKGCLAWGVYRQHNWTCWSCRWWQSHYPLGVCDVCGRLTRIGEQRACRLCLEQARMLQEPGRAVDLSGSNSNGQQLFLANMHFKRRTSPRLQPARRGRPGPPPRGFAPSMVVQPALFEIAPDAEMVRQRALVEDSELTRYCAAVVREHAATFGWSKRQRNDVIRSLRLLQTLRENPTAKICASDVLQLPRYDGNITSTLDVLAAAGLLIEDRPTRVENYFASKTATLPPAMKHELEVWLQVMLDGSATAPRRHSRDPLTVRIHVMGIAPILQAWALAGHQSLAEITGEHVRAALPASGSQRTWAESGLRSLFTVLRTRKMTFINPTRGMKTTPVNPSVPLPLPTEDIRQALNSPDPAIALAVALVAFHALTSKQIRQLQITDIVDGRLALDRRVIPLADPVRVRLVGWLDHRAATWPDTINPHLFVSRRSAPRLVPVGAQFPWKKTNLRPQALREDRILQEIHATGGDIRRICDLFGISVETATRYASTLGHPGLELNGSVSSRIPDPT